jgi:hypothetical protein
MRLRTLRRGALQRRSEPETGEGGSQSKFPEHSNDLAEDLDVRGVDRLER